MHAFCISWSGLLIQGINRFSFSREFQIVFQKLLNQSMHLLAVNEDAYCPHSQQFITFSLFNFCQSGGGHNVISIVGFISISPFLIM